MKRVFTLLNELKAANVVRDYALGGATALVYYFEPVQTQDVDVFVVFEKQSTFVDLHSIYSFFKDRGGVEQGEYIVVDNTPLQFLSPYNPLVEEAVTMANTVAYSDTSVRIPSLEHLMAIMVQTGRFKDKARLEEIRRLALPYDEKRFAEILGRFGLEDKWRKLLGEFGNV